MSITSVIITGAKGRMGSTLLRLVQEDSRFALAGVLEKRSKQAGLEGLDCPVSDDPSLILDKDPQATIIDFTNPEFSANLAGLAAQSGNPVVIGTTGLDEAQKESIALAAVKVPIFWAPNMSVGISVLLEMLPRLARMLGEVYDLELVETHHRFKKDAPSGTALKLAQVLAEARDWGLPDVAKYCREGISGERPQAEVGVQSLRGGDVVGDHSVYFLGLGERIEVTHRAHSRETFAQGALRAARWIGLQSPGRVYSMSEMVSL